MINWVVSDDTVDAETVVQRCSVKKVFLEILQNSLENTCARSTGNQAMKLSLLIECNIRNIYFEKTYAKCSGETSPTLFSKRSKLGIYLDQQCLMSYRVCFWSSHQSCSARKGVLINFTKFTGKQLCQNLFFNKVAGLRPATLLKKRLWHSCFPVNFVDF